MIFVCFCCQQINNSSSTNNISKVTFLDRSTRSRVHSFLFEIRMMTYTLFSTEYLHIIIFHIRFFLIYIFNE